MRQLTLIQLIGLATFSIFTLEACATAHTSGTATPPVAAQRDTVAVKLKSNSWTPQVTVGTYRYLIHDSSTISISNDTSSGFLPIESTTIYSLLLIDTGDSLTVISHLESLAMITRLPVKSTDDIGNVLESRTTISKQGQLAPIVQQSSTACTALTASVSSRISELIVSFPTARFQVGDKWTDTTSTISCHGRIPLRQQAIQEYEILDLALCAERNAVKVRRIVSDTFSGVSAESHNHLSTSGSGTSASILCLQRESGALIESNGQSRVDLTVVTIRGTFPFTQNMITQIELQ